MSVAKISGVADHECALMSQARAAWPRWCEDVPALAVVDELVALRAWTRSASRQVRGGVVAALAEQTREDPAAITALVWLLIPGATRLAARLGDLSPDIDALVAGQLWIEAAEAWRAPVPRTAGTVLRRVRAAICVELGVGEAARRTDRAWANTVPTGLLDQKPLQPAAEDSRWLLTELLMDAMTDHAIAVFDAWLIGELARVAAAMDAPAQRGRQGLTTPAVVECVGEQVGLCARTLRRRAGKALDRLAEYVAVREDPERFAVWKARHRASLSVQEEMQLVIFDDAPAYWIKNPGHGPSAVHVEGGRDQWLSGSA